MLDCCCIIASVSPIRTLFLIFTVQEVVQVAVNFVQEILPNMAETVSITGSPCSRLF